MNKCEHAVDVDVVIINRFKRTTMIKTHTCPKCGDSIADRYTLLNRYNELTKKAESV